jgi:hypothetical protein
LSFNCASVGLSGSADVPLGTLGRKANPIPPDPIRIEDHVRMFHAECGGIVVGVLGEPLRCAECGTVMAAFVSDYDRVTLGKPRHGLALVPPPERED